MGHEKTLTGLIPALAGANMIYGLGMVESGITFDYGQLVLDCEFARMIKHGCGSFATCLTTVFGSHTIPHFPSVLLDYFKMASFG